METTKNRVENPSFETVWAALQEVAEQQKETDRLQKKYAEQREKDTIQWEKDAEQRKEEAEQRKEEHRQWRERSNQLDKQLGKLGNRFGEMIEYMVAPNLITKFHELDLDFDKANLDSIISDKKHNIYTEVDITLENGDKVMLVEVKSKPVTADITEHIERMQKVRAYADFRGDKRKFLGAIAGMIIKENVKAFALKNGFYIIEPSGETFNITAPKGIYSPQEW